MLYRKHEDIDFEITDQATFPLPEKVLMVEPTYYDVQYVINPHMIEHVGKVDKEAAYRQWELLKEAYETLHYEVHVLPGVKGLPDMVFAANQTLPFYRSSGEKGVVLSRMHSEERKPEVAYFQRFFAAQGYETLEIPPKYPGSFEGGGDAIWHFNRYILWAGYGFRTDLEPLRYIQKRLDVPVLALELLDPDFYHLDTCFSVLDERSVLICVEAFQADGLGLIERMFERVIYAPEKEARELMACNAHCPDGKHVLLQKGCEETVVRLQKAGFIPVEIETSEFLKAGGSVYCLKQMFW